MQNVKIPQNIQIEDKLIGPLSIRQIIIVGIGLGTSYTLVSAVKKSAGTIPYTAHVYIWLPAIIAIAFAMVKINDISLFRYCLLMVEMMLKPRRRVWRPREGLFINVLTHAALEREERAMVKATKKSEKMALVEAKTTPRLDELSVILDREGRAPASVTRRMDTVHSTDVP